MRLFCAILLIFCSRQTGELIVIYSVVYSSAGVYHFNVAVTLYYTYLIPCAFSKLEYFNLVIFCTSVVQYMMHIFCSYFPFVGYTLIDVNIY
jgi:hypothetical protein